MNEETDIRQKKKKKKTEHSYISFPSLLTELLVGGGSC